MLPWLLFVAALYTVGRVGILHAATFTMATGSIPRAWSLDNVLLSLYYTGGVFAILGAHEGGHWLAARRHGTPTRGPFLFPLPLQVNALVSLPFMWFGIAGAWLRMPKLSALPARAKWDIAASGVIAGALVTLLCTLLGVAWSVPHPQAGVRSWHPYLFDALTAGVIWHPLLWAAWLGWLLTAISLLPIPGLDGGRIVQSVRGVSGWRRWGSAGLLGLGLACWL